MGDPERDRPVRTRIGRHDDPEAVGDGSVIAILKRLRTLLGGALQIEGEIEGAVEVTNEASNAVYVRPGTAATWPITSAALGEGPEVESFASAVIDLAASTNNQTIIAAPGAGRQIWVYGLALLADTAAGTVRFHDSTPTNLTGVMAVSDEGGFVLPLSGNFAMPYYQCATNTAFQADTGACTVDGSVHFAVVVL